MVSNLRKVLLQDKMNLKFNNSPFSLDRQNCCSFVLWASFLGGGWTGSTGAVPNRVEVAASVVAGRACSLVVGRACFARTSCPSRNPFHDHSTTF